MLVNGPWVLQVHFPIMTLHVTWPTPKSVIIKTIRKGWARRSGWTNGRNNDRIDAADEKGRRLFTAISLKKLHVPLKHSVVQLGPVLQLNIEGKMLSSWLKCLMLKLAVLTSTANTNLPETRDDLSNHAHTFAWTKTTKVLHAKSQSLPSNHQNARSHDSSASGWLNPILIETVKWKRHSWQRCTKISQKPRRCSFPRPAELYFHLHQYKVCVCSCTCYTSSSKTCIKLVKSGHFWYQLQRSVWGLRAGLNIQVRTGFWLG